MLPESAKTVNPERYSYGNGIYTNLNPAEGDRFSTSSMSSPYNVMVLCDFIMDKMTRVFPKLRRPESVSEFFFEPTSASIDKILPRPLMGDEYLSTVQIISLPDM